LSTKDGQLVKEITGKRLGFLGFTQHGGGSLLIRYKGRHGESKSVLDGATEAERFAPRLFSRSRPELSPDGRTIAFADESGSVSILDARTGRTLVRGDGIQYDASALAFSLDGSLLAAADDSGAVCVWDSSTLRLRTRFSSDDPVYRWGPTAAAIVIYSLATIFLRRAKRRARDRRNSRNSGDWPRRFRGQFPAVAPAGAADRTIQGEGFPAVADSTPAAQRMWDHWLDG
jgi:hypothetical protein